MGDTTKPAAESNRACQSTPAEELERQIMSAMVPKNEREHWASSEIHRLRDVINGGCPMHPKPAAEPEDFASRAARAIVNDVVDRLIGSLDGCTITVTDEHEKERQRWRERYADIIRAEADPLLAKLNAEIDLAHGAIAERDLLRTELTAADLAFRESRAEIGKLKVELYNALGDVAALHRTIERLEVSPKMADDLTDKQLCHRMSCGHCSCSLVDVQTGDACAMCEKSAAATRHDLFMAKAGDRIRTFETEIARLLEADRQYSILAGSVIKAKDEEIARLEEESGRPVPIILHCPECKTRHIDEGEFTTKPHHTHACQGCGFVWRPTIGPTVGVAFLPGFKNEMDGELQVEPTSNSLGNPSSSALAAGGSAKSDMPADPEREPVTADSKGQPRADEASRPTSTSPSIDVPPHLAPFQERCCSLWPHDLTMSCRDAEPEGEQTVEPEFLAAEAEVHANVMQYIDESFGPNRKASEPVTFAEPASEPVECPACGHVHGSDIRCREVVDRYAGDDTARRCQCRNEFRERALKKIAEADGGRKRFLRDALVMLAGCGIPTPEKGYGSHGDALGHLLSDIRTAFAIARATIAAREDEAAAANKAARLLSANYERELTEAKFAPLGDNHHNAARCPYCNPEFERLAAHRPVVTLETREEVAIQIMQLARCLNDAEARSHWDDHNYGWHPHWLAEADRIIAIITNQ